MGGNSASSSASRIAAIILGGVVSTVAAPAYAQGRQTSNTVPVSLEVATNCRLSTNPLMFGNVTKNQKTVRATTTMSFSCTPGTVFTVAIDNGKYWDGTSRRMWGDQAQGQVWYASYALYRDPLYTLPWGSTLATSAVGIVGLTGKQTLTLYGEADLKNVRAAPYLDTVTVVLDF